VITVNLIAKFAPAFVRQSPANDGVWEDLRFLINSTQPTDYCVVFNFVHEPWQVSCRPGNLWLLMQEPPTDFYKAMHCGDQVYDRVLTQDTGLTGNRYLWTQPANNWHVCRSYTELVDMPAGEKSRGVSAVVSDKSMFHGHRDRLAFLDRLKSVQPLDHYGRGFQEIADKWDGLAPYRYSLAVENFRNPFYWTEKIADCFLARTMPIYCGCTRITEYFPLESLILFDLEDPDAPEKIREAVAGDAWGRNRDAIEHARSLVLERYQLLPFLAAQIRSHRACCGATQETHRQRWVYPQPGPQQPAGLCGSFLRGLRGMVGR
jgi:hypothetical protein